MNESEYNGYGVEKDRFIEMAREVINRCGNGK
jgi:hypothetical protein